jgi:rRNA-processing protein FCF1
LDKVYYEILKKIQDYRNKKIPVWWQESSEFNKGYVKSLIADNYITSDGIFALTEKGTSALMDYLKIEFSQKSPKKYIFDTNVFDDIIDGKVSIDLIEENIKNKFIEIYITHIQSDEIQNCSDIERRKKLSLFILKIKPIILATESFILGKSRLGFSRLGAGEIYNKINTKSNNHSDDALIGETAIENDLILVSNDKRLVSNVLKNNGKVIFVKEFIEILNNYDK